jgi:hypothetical protein
VLSSAVQRVMKFIILFRKQSRELTFLPPRVKTLQLILNPFTFIGPSTYSDNVNSFTDGPFAFKTFIAEKNIPLIVTCRNHNPRLHGDYESGHVDLVMGPREEVTNELQYMIPRPTIYSFNPSSCTEDFEPQTLFF